MKVSLRPWSTSAKAKPRRTGAESVLDYPRPPRVEATDAEVEVVFNGTVLASSHRVLRWLERGMAPKYYLPFDDVKMQYLRRTTTPQESEWAGPATHYNIRVGGRESRDAAWALLHPPSKYGPVRDHVSFYPERVDACIVDGVRVIGETNRALAGWITPDLSDV